MIIDLEDPRYAYLLGFLLGDGHLYAGRGRKGRLSVELHVRDEPLLQRFQPLLPGSILSRRVRTTNFSRGHYETATLSCSLLEVRQALIDAGMPVGPKHRTARPPDVPYSLRDFARGMCDADGSLGMTGRGQPFISLVTNSPALADWWCGEVVAHVGTKRTWKPNARDGVANIMVAMEPAVALVGWLYQEGDVALDRKAAAAREISGWERPEGMRRAYTAKRWTDEEDLVLSTSTLSQIELAEQLGRTVKSINLRSWHLRMASRHDR